ncbi:MAG: PorT family protein [Bacteroidales bacterium]|jgi:hypothetical protein|nr:PorT family protein [Bacteroidales bacterium]
MKKSIIIAAILFSGYTANSQVLISLLLGDALNSDKIEFGLDGGVNFARISNLEPSESLNLFNLGFYFDIRIKNQLMLHTGVIVKSNQGADRLDPYSLDNPDLDAQFADGYVTRKVNNFSVPILLKYRFAERFHLEAGPMLALRTRAYDEFKSSLVDDDDLRYTLAVQDNYKRIDAGIMCGAGIKLYKKIPKSSQIGIRYYYGLVDPLIENTGKPQNFSSLYLYFSIPIGVQKTETKAE